MEELHKLLELIAAKSNYWNDITTIPDEDLEKIQKVLADGIVKKSDRSVFNLSFMKAIKLRCKTNEEGLFNDSITNLVAAIEDIMQIINN